VIPADFRITFTDAQLTQIERHPGYAKLGDCPVCDGKGTYAYLGNEYECPAGPGDVHIAKRLSMLYFLHNIPMGYQNLVWEEWPEDTETQQHAKNSMDLYVESFKRFSMNGVGLTFFSKGLGTGKTWGATATLKRLVKNGVDGWFAPFYEVKSYFEIADKTERDFKIKRVKESELLVLDEVRMPGSEAQRNFYADRLEELVRPRTDNNYPTIITTNMTPEELEDTYPRVFSLMSAKNLVIELDGSDYRLGTGIWQRNVESGQNAEALPIT